MKLPPLLPEEMLPRVVRTANTDGLCVLAIAGFFALAAASSGDYYQTGVGLLIAAAGAIELHGAGLLRAGDARGMRWVLASQPYLLLILLAYCATQLAFMDAGSVATDTLDLVGRIGGAEAAERLRQDIQLSGKTPAQALGPYLRTGYGAFAAAALLFQGGMTVYYWRRRQAVVAALEGESVEDGV